MKSISENYRESHSNTHETFADLVFCALVVLLLFVLALTVEVSQRQRATANSLIPVEVPAAEDVARMTPQEIEELSRELLKQQEEVKQLRSQMAANSSKVKHQLSAMSGEQRFTGAREPAAFHMAYNYDNRRFYFIPAKDLNHADRRKSGESDLSFLTRKRGELADIALAARETRGFTLAEASAIYQSASRYKLITPTASSYRIDDEELGIYYHVLLCEYIAGDVSTSTDHEPEIVAAILAMGDQKGPLSDDMYPKCSITVDTRNRELTLAGVKLQPLDLRAILLSVDGRGLMLDFEGYDGNVPQWLYDQVLAPAGYVGKTPKPPTP